MLLALYRVSLTLLVCSTLFVLSPTAYAADKSLMDGLEYRLIGPWRGGRVTAVTGVADQPLRYYMGATGGGVWKTENAGLTWGNISDGQIPVGTIGAIAVAKSDPNVIYVGSGEAPIRGVTSSQGEGIWKSTDAGQTFTFIGLPKAGQIAKIEIHPTDPDTAYVAVQGQIWAPNEERGIYRTQDGGKTWEQVLKVNADTGATDLSMDDTNPRILYAAMWHHGRKPWFIKSGGEGGGIYKSVDAGDSWEKLEGGLPDLVGKIGVDVSASQPSRIYAIIEAEPGEGGLWRSDDYGKTWQHINAHRVLHSRAWYYIHITADPVDPDTVWVMNVPLMKSIDGGATWEKIDTPHGDHHDHWINPTDNRNMINANDGGATVTFDGGATWSSIYNQPTAQFYRLVTDNQTPWRLYAGQQDNSTVSIAAWAWDGGIGEDDYHAVGGGESAHIAFDPDDPTLVYATTINGTLTEYNDDDKKTRYIIPYPERVFGKDSKDIRYRTNWNAPVITSPHDHSVIYYGTQYLMKSTDRGMTWEEISPDLTRNNPAHMGRNGGPLTPENVGAEFYHTVFYIVESNTEEGTIWVGADDGLLHLTRNGGEDWQNISPPHRDEAMINAIELSPHAAGTAYVAVTGYKLNDFSPYIYKTTNYGRNWRRIENNIPAGAFVRAVREDPLVPDLLYAGTEKGMFVSYNGGDEWQSLDLNLPAVPVTDLRVRENALAIATQGRAFWVLDDLYVVREAKTLSADAAVHVFTPPPTVMGRPGSSPAADEGGNPSPDVPIYYYLGEDVPADAELAIAILDTSGAVIRSYSSVESDQDRCRLGNTDPRRPFKISYPTAVAGLNHWGWDGHGAEIGCIDNIMLHDGYAGPNVGPGRYTLRVSAAGASADAEFEVLPDPRSAANAAEMNEWLRLQARVGQMLEDVLQTLDRARHTRMQVNALLTEQTDAKFQALATGAVAGIDAWETTITQLKHETYEDEDAWPVMLDGQIRHLFDVIGQSGAPVTSGAKERLGDLESMWSERQRELQRIEDTYIAPVNDWARVNGVPHVASAL